MTWLKGVGIATLGWAVTFATIYLIVVIGDLHRLDGLLFAGPLVSVWLLVDAVKAALRRRRERRRANRPE
ncbi:hypothetical protein [Glaciihabitans sp. dw_435]|uniref:hypothetical protein n=1 Tax=Glaciihabitans sp. dw_435 TaxID=2720081 RepID=UPI001BD5252A|nr:hypothetical protein [Glaciihabitans sp. dw_435]